LLLRQGQALLRNIFIDLLGNDNTRVFSSTMTAVALNSKTLEVRHSSQPLPQGYAKTFRVREAVGHSKTEAENQTAARPLWADTGNMQASRERSLRTAID
jgi:hypothetical protein